MVFNFYVHQVKRDHVYAYGNATYACSPNDNRASANATSGKHSHNLHNPHNNTKYQAPRRTHDSIIDPNTCYVHPEALQHQNGSVDEKGGKIQNGGGAMFMRSSSFGESAEEENGGKCLTRKGKIVISIVFVVVVIFLAFAAMVAAYFVFDLG